jgi:hypothetical protein
MNDAAPSSILAASRQTGTACVEAAKARPTANAKINVRISTTYERTCAALLANAD